MQTNGFYYRKPQYDGYGFETFIVSNLPKSDIVNGTQSAVLRVQGRCEERTFHIAGTLFMNGRDKAGFPVGELPAEQVEREVQKNSPMEKAFDVLCKIAMTPQPQ